MRRFLLEELAQKLGATLIGDPSYLISGLGGLDEAGPSDISFLANPRYHDSMIRSKAGAICISHQEKPLPGKNFLLCNDPSETFQQLIELFIPPLPSSSFSRGIHPTAAIDLTAQVSPHAHIGPYCVIGAGAVIHKGVKLIAHVYIGEESIIEEDALIHPHVTIRERCHLGKRVVIQPGAVIGSCGFGYLSTSTGHHKLQQLGGVVLEDDVEIGANTTIDRARFHQTKISSGSKIDNLVQIGHNVQLGRHNLIVSQVGIAGSSKTGDYVVLGGQVGVVGHVEIASGTLVGAKSGISKTVEKAGRYSGVPLQPHADYNKQQVLLRKLPELFSKLKKIEEKLQ